MADPSSPTAAPTADPTALLRALEQEQARDPGDAGAPFALDGTSLVIGLVVSMVGVAGLRYARAMGDPLVGVIGVMLLVVPFALDGPLAVVGASGALIAVALVLRKLQLL